MNIKKLYFSPLSPFFFPFCEGRKWKHSQTFSYDMSEEKGKQKKTSFNTNWMGLFRKTAGILPWMLLGSETHCRQKASRKKHNCLPLGAFLIVCCSFIWQLKVRFGKKSGDTVKLVPSHSHFSSGNSALQFMVLRHHNGMEYIPPKYGLELVDHSS